jgi:outer membrane protein assembly factor BamE (lipoprotein component of BamABCDE complex)
MKNTLLFIIILLFFSNCSLNKVINHHGVNALEIKKEKLIINKSNSNDVEKLLGPPSTKGAFDENLWIFIERKTSSSKLTKLGKRTLISNNILIVELDTKGILINKIFLNKEQINDMNFSSQITQMNYTKRSFIYNFLSSMRQKINDPLGKKKLN